MKKAHFITLASQERKDILSRLAISNGSPTRIIIILDIDLDEKSAQLVMSLSSELLAVGNELTVVCTRLKYLNEVGSLFPAGTRLKYAENFVSTEELDEVDNHVKRWSRTWYQLACLQDYQMALHYRDIPLGGIVEYNILVGLPQLLKNVKTLTNVLLSEGPSLILFITNSTQMAHIGRHVAEQKGYPLVTVWENGDIQSRQAFPLVQRLSHWIGRLFDYLLFYWDWLTLRSPLNNKDKTVFVENSDRLYDIFDALKMRAGMRVLLIEWGGATLSRVRALLQKRLFRTMVRRSLRSSSRVINARERLRKAWQSIQTDPSFHSFFNFDGLTLWPLVEPKMAEVFEILLPKIIGDIEATHDGFVTYRPDVFIMGNDITPIERVFCAVARQRKLPTLHIQHGVYAGFYAGHDVITSDVVAAWGKSQREAYASHGNDSSRVRVVGAPLLDGLYQRSNQSGRETKARERIYGQLGLSCQKGIFIFATSDSGDRMESITAHQSLDTGERAFLPILEVMKHFPDKQLIVKLHPKEPFEAYHRMLVKNSRYKDQVKVVKYINIHDLIDASELIITSPSTVALEAIILGKPTIIVQLAEDKRRLPVFRDFPVMYVCDDNELLTAINLTLYNPELREHLANERRKFLTHGSEYQVDGKAMTRLLAIIDDLAAGRVHE